MQTIRKIRNAIRYSLILILGIIPFESQAQWPMQWQPIESIVDSRVKQEKSKMKLTAANKRSLENFLTQLKPSPALEKLQLDLPKTTVELLRSVETRNVPLEEAEKMASYLSTLLKKFEFQNPAPFDENTSHIIGRNWPEIDYSGENMTWEKQKLKYQPYGIKDFKSLDMLEKFFPVEAKLPYFKKIYKPKHPDALMLM
jgi:hypothetical protein